jgi:hypothetical protein
MAKVHKKSIVVRVDRYDERLEDRREYEDKLSIDINGGVYTASQVDGVRLYPFIRTGIAPVLGASAHRVLRRRAGSGACGWRGRSGRSPAA